MAKSFDNIRQLVVGEFNITQDQKKSYKITMTGDALKFLHRSNTSDNFVINKDGSFTLPSTLETSPSTPAAGGVVYVKSDGKLYFKNSSGTEYDMTDTGLDVSTLSDLDAAPASGDFIVIQDITDNSTKKVSVSNLTSTIDADITSVVAGSGLTGGATDGDATLNIGAGTGITVNADDVQTNDSQIVHDNLSGFVANEHIDHSSVSITAGTGLSGGGDLTSTRTLSVDLSELTDMTQAINSAQDELILLDNGSDRRKLISEIPVSAFNNDSGFQTSAGGVATATDATNATNVTTATDSGNATHYPTFVDSLSATQQIKTDNGIQYNPSTNTLTTVKLQATSEVEVYDGATSSDTIVKMYDSNDDGVIDIYQNDSVKIRLHGNDESYINTGNGLCIGTTTLTPSQEKLRIMNDNGDNFNTVVIWGADTSTEYVALGVKSGVPTITGGYSGTGTAKLAFQTSNDDDGETTRMTLDEDGNLGISTASPGGKLSINGGADPSKTDGIHLYTDNDDWYIYPKRISSSTTNVNLQFVADSTEYGYIDDGGSNDMMNFTGQHRCLPDASTDFETLSGSVGKIVVSSGQYDNPNPDARGVTINEAIPTIRLSNSRKQKSVFGVISDSEDPLQKDRTYNFGAFGTNRPKKNPEDLRLHINSLGEGGIWVSDINGFLENGDYITTCEIPGYGMKQDSEMLCNYTVAKITMDCLFDLESTEYECREVEHNGETYITAFVGCTYHCG